MPVEALGDVDGGRRPCPVRRVCFYPLIGRRPSSEMMLVEQTLRSRVEDYFPGFFRRAGAFGDHGCGSYRGIRLDVPGEVFDWHPSDREDHRVIRIDPPAAWRGEKRRYDEPGSGA